MLVGSGDSFLLRVQLYWPKLRADGIFAGHDFLDVDEVPGQDWCAVAFVLPSRQGISPALMAFRLCRSVGPDGKKRTDNKAVRSAVVEFAVKVNRQLMITYRWALLALLWPPLPSV